MNGRMSLPLRIHLLPHGSMLVADNFNYVLGVLALPALLGGCASVNKTLYKPDQLRGIQAWAVVFAYEPGRLETRREASGEAGVKVVAEGRDPRDLQLRDDIMFRLQDKHGLTVTKDADGPVGQIRIHPVHFYSGGFKSLDVTLSSPSGDTLARIRVKNGDRNATFKEDDEFADYAADAIAAAIRDAE